MDPHRLRPKQVRGGALAHVADTAAGSRDPREARSEAETRALTGAEALPPKHAGKAEEAKVRGRLHSAAPPTR